MKILLLIVALALPLGAQAQRLLPSWDLEHALAPIAHFPDRDILAAIGSNPDLAHTYSVQPSEVWRVVNELRQHAGGGPAPQTVIVNVVRPVVVHKLRPVPPPGPNGPPSAAAKMQQGHLPSPAVRMQQQRTSP